MRKTILAQSKNGKGIFANIDIKKGENIIQFKGKLYSKKNIPKKDLTEDHCVQIGKDLYMGASGKNDDYVNHSCNPNSALIIKGKNAILIAIKNIIKGKEITWDYSTTTDDGNWKMECKCGSKNCRKTIKNFNSLPNKLKQKYIKLGIVPDFLTRK